MPHETLAAALTALERITQIIESNPSVPLSRDNDQALNPIFDRIAETKQQDVGKADSDKAAELLNRLMAVPGIENLKNFRINQVVPYFLYKILDRTNQKARIEKLLADPDPTGFPYDQLHFICYREIQDTKRQENFAWLIGEYWSRLPPAIQSELVTYVVYHEDLGAQAEVLLSQEHSEKYYNLLIERLEDKKVNTEYMQQILKLFWPHITIFDALQYFDIVEQQLAKKDDAITLADDYMTFLIPNNIDKITQAIKETMQLDPRQSPQMWEKLKQIADLIRGVDWDTLPVEDARAIITPQLQKEIFALLKQLRETSADKIFIVFLIRFITPDRLLEFIAQIEDEDKRLEFIAYILQSKSFAGIVPSLIQGLDSEQKGLLLNTLLKMHAYSACIDLLKIDLPANAVQILMLNAWKNPKIYSSNEQRARHEIFAWLLEQNRISRSVAAEYIKFWRSLADPDILSYEQLYREKFYKIRSQPLTFPAEVKIAAKTPETAIIAFIRELYTEPAYKPRFPYAASDVTAPLNPEFKLQFEEIVAKLHAWASVEVPGPDGTVTRCKKPAGFQIFLDNIKFALDPADKPAAWKDYHFAMNYTADVKQSLEHIYYYLLNGHVSEQEKILYINVLLEEIAQCGPGVRQYIQICLTSLQALGYHGDILEFRQNCAVEAFKRALIRMGFSEQDIFAVHILDNPHDRQWVFNLLSKDPIFAEDGYIDIAGELFAATSSDPYLADPDVARYIGFTIDDGELSPRDIAQHRSSFVKFKREIREQFLRQHTLSKILEYLHGKLAKSLSVNAGSIDKLNENVALLAELKKYDILDPQGTIPYGLLVDVTATAEFRAIKADLYSSVDVSKAEKWQVLYNDQPVAVNTTQDHIVRFKLDDEGIRCCLSSRIQSQEVTAEYFIKKDTPSLAIYQKIKAYIDNGAQGNNKELHLLFDAFIDHVLPPATIDVDLGRYYLTKAMQKKGYLAGGTGDDVTSRYKFDLKGKTIECIYLQDVCYVYKHEKQPQRICSLTADDLSVADFDLLTQVWSNLSPNMQDKIACGLILDNRFNLLEKLYIAVDVNLPAICAPMNMDEHQSISIINIMFTNKIDINQRDLLISALFIKPSIMATSGVEIFEFALVEHLANPSKENSLFNILGSLLRNEVITSYYASRIDTHELPEEEANIKKDLAKEIYSALRRIAQKHSTVDDVILILRMDNEIFIDKIAPFLDLNIQVLLRPMAEAVVLSAQTLDLTQARPLTQAQAQAEEEEARSITSVEMNSFLKWMLRYNKPDEVKTYITQNMPRIISELGNSPYLSTWWQNTAQSLGWAVAPAVRLGR